MSKPLATLYFQFDNVRAAEHFKTWLAEQGVLDYWEYMREREIEEDGDITGLRFDYERGAIIPVECGRFEGKTNE